jgi:nucleotide-binding universal stress UspA family protein
VVIIYKKILLAIDKSEQSIRAIEKVIDLQKKCKCKVVMFHSIKHPSKILFGSMSHPSSYGSYYVCERELLYEYRKEGESLLNTRKVLFNKEQLSVETRLITEENPEDYIEQTVEKERFDLVVIGTKGIHSKLNQVILGTVAGKVVKHAPCDVLIIR